MKGPPVIGPFGEYATHRLYSRLGWFWLVLVTNMYYGSHWMIDSFRIMSSPTS